MQCSGEGFSFLCLFSILEKQTKTRFLPNVGIVVVATSQNLGRFFDKLNRRNPFCTFPSILRGDDHSRRSPVPNRSRGLAFFLLAIRLPNRIPDEQTGTDTNRRIRDIKRRPVVAGNMKLNEVDDVSVNNTVKKIAKRTTDHSQKGDCDGPLRGRRRGQTAVGSLA